jgi:hypothetical protein
MLKTSRDYCLPAVMMQVVLIDVLKPDASTGVESCGVNCWAFEFTKDDIEGAPQLGYNS